MSNKCTCLRGINGFLMVFVSIFLASCSSTSRITDEQIVIEMEKTACYGRCPVYTIKIDKQGTGLFIGVEHTEPLGLYSFRLKKSEMEELHSAFERIGFFGLEDRYYDNISDLPTTYLTYRKESREKKIMDYHGAPPELKQLESRIQELVLSKKMRKVR